MTNWASQIPASVHLAILNNYTALLIVFKGLLRLFIFNSFPVREWLREINCLQFLIHVEYYNCGFDFTTLYFSNYVIDMSLGTQRTHPAQTNASLTLRHHHLLELLCLPGRPPTCIHPWRSGCCCMTDRAIARAALLHNCLRGEQATYCLC